MFIYNEKYVSKKEGNYYSCPWIEHGLVFFKYKLALCCNCGHEGSSQPLIRNNFIGQRINWNRVFKIKEMYRNYHKKGKIHTGCINCPYLEERAWDGENYIDNLYISHWTHCNSKCIYCYSAQNPKEFSINKTYNIMPYIKEMYENGILKAGGQISFGGGEPVVVVLFEGAVEDRAVGEADLRDAFGVDEQGFAAEVEVERHIRAFPGFGDFAADVEPAAIEFFAPAIADFGRVVGQGQPFLKRNRFLCDGDFRGERHALQNDFVGQAPVGFGNAVFVYVQIKMGHGTPARIRGK